MTYCGPTLQAETLRTMLSEQTSTAVVATGGAVPNPSREKRSQSNGSEGVSSKQPQRKREQHEQKSVVSSTDTCAPQHCCPSLSTADSQTEHKAP